MNKLWKAGLCSVAAIALYAQFAPLVITTGSPLPFAVRGQSYQLQLQATGGGGGYQWQHNDEGNPLPTGFFVTSGGIIGSTTVVAPAGLYNFGIDVFSNSEDSAFKAFDLRVFDRVQVTAASLPAATRNAAYAFTFAATGGSSSTYVWHLTSGSLPTGLTLNQTTGQVSGTPTGAASVYNFSLTATDTVGQVSAPQAFNLTVHEVQLSISPPQTLSRGAVSVPYSQALSATGGSGVYSWTILTGGTGLPPGLTLTAAGVVQGTPTASGQFSFRARVADNSTFEPQAQAADYSVFINPLLVITSVGLPNGVVGVPYSQQLTATGGQQPPLTWTITDGALPTGLSMTSSGLITGTPTEGFPFQFTAQVVDGGSGQGQQVRSHTFTVHIVFPPLSITTTALAPATANVAYLQSLAAVGGEPPYQWRLISGKLPNGVTLNGAGSLSGTPTEAGSFPIVIGVRDSQEAAFEASRGFTLSVDAGSPIITTTGLPVVQPQTQYSQTLTATGGTPPYSFTLTGGSLPSGFAFTSSGQIFGSGGDAGSSTITVRVTDQRGRSSEKILTLTIAPRSPDTESRVEIATTSLPDAAAGKVYGIVLAARNGRAPYTWSVAGLPPGLTSNLQGEIIGTPTRVGSFPLEIAVSDDTGGRALASLTLVVKGSVSITTERVPNGRVGDPYSVPFTANGGLAPYVFAFLGGISPQGLSFNTTGVLTGTPARAGTFPFTVQVSDRNGQTATRDYSLVIAPAGLAISTNSLGSGSVNAAFSVTLVATGGRPQYRWAVTGLPEGLELNASTGEITGTPTRQGTFPVAAQVTDQDNQSASKDFTLEITSGLAITTTSVGDFPVGVSVSRSLGASGGRPPYSWSVTGGALPGGVILSGEGAISGTPTATGPYSFTAQVRDQNNQTATRTFTGSVVVGLNITTQSAPNGQAGVSYSLGLAATGGTGPYRWSSLGSLPPGLTLNAEGSVSGTPTAAGTFSFTAVVTDAATPSQTAQRLFSVVITLPQLSGLTIVVPGNPQPQQQPNIGVTIDQPFPAEITGTLTLTFAPNTVNNADDPFIQFSTGGRSVTFTIPAGQTQAVFRTPTVGVQIGTTAGTITLTTNLQSGGSQLGCNCELVRTIVIPRGVAVISGVRVQRTATGFTVTITGFSTSREITQGIFRFVGANLQTSEVTVPLTTVFNSWFQSAPSQQFGGQFSLAIPFTVQGDLQSVTSVTVLLTNGAGNSQPSTASF